MEEKADIRCVNIAKIERKPIELPVSFIPFMAKNTLIFTNRNGFIIVKELASRSMNIDNLSPGIHFAFCVKVKYYTSKMSLQDEVHYFNLNKSSDENIQAILDGSDNLFYPNLESGLPDIHDAIKAFVLSRYEQKKIVAIGVGYKLVINNGTAIQTASCIWPSEPTYMASTLREEDFFEVVRNINRERYIAHVIEMKPWEAMNLVLDESAIRRNKASD